MTIANPTRSNRQGLLLRRSLLNHPQLGIWIAGIDAQYQAIATAQNEGGPAASSQLVALGQRYVPTASSLTIGAVASDEIVTDLLRTIAAGPAGAWMQDELRGRLACDLDQAWVRRQYAPERYPPLHAPHGWHQDGGLRFDYLSPAHGKFPRDAMLQMVTCWIALAPCGREAPGLEFVRLRFEELFEPVELKPERIAARFAPDEFWRPVLEAGDALLFRGDILHRTHIAQAMTRDRSSIELRFFPLENLPARLNGDRFISIDGLGGAPPVLVGG